jgi:acyl-coenzyme A thioesterase PaaI-like protein
VSKSSKSSARSLKSLSLKSLSSVLAPAVETIAQALPEKARNTLYVRSFGFFSVPLIYYISPTVLELTDDHCVIEIPLNRRTRNHLNSMYFGVLSAGADVAGGLIAMRLAQRAGMDMVFKDFKASFLKRAEGPTQFRCDAGQLVAGLVARAEKSGEREECAVRVVATVPTKLGSEPVAEFELTLSVKKRKPR